MKKTEHKSARYLTLQQAATIAKFPKLSVRVTRGNVFVYKTLLQLEPEVTIPREDSEYILEDRRARSLLEALHWAHFKIYGCAPTPEKAYR